MSSVLRLIPVPMSPGPEAPEMGADCPHCGEALDLHQPDAGLPERLLGTSGPAHLIPGISA